MDELGKQIFQEIKLLDHSYERLLYYFILIENFYRPFLITLMNLKKINKN